MATLQNKRIKNTYQSLLKTEDNGNLNSSQKEITDGQGTGSGVYLDTNGNLKANGTIEFGSLKDTGEDITITKLVNLADGIENNNNDTTIPTTAAIKSYADSKTAPIDTVNGQTGDVVLDTDDISEGTTNLYYTESRVSANTSVAANTAKTGITAQQASDIETNNAKISFDSTSSTKLAGIETGAQVNTVDSVNSQTGAVSLDTDDVSEGTTNLYYTDTRVAANSAVSANTAKTGITTDQSNAIIANTAKNSYPTADATKLAGIESGAEVNPTSTDELSEGSTNLYFTDARVSANSDVTTNTAKVGITTEQADAITANTAKNSYPTTDATKLAGIEVGAEVNPTSTDQLTEGSTNLYYTDTRVSANTDVATNTAKISFDSTSSTKLAGIETGAEVNVQANWNETDTNSDAYIIGKPTIPTAAVDSVNTQTGDVVLDTDDISEGTTNLYYTEARVSANTNVATNTLKNSYPTTDSTKVGFISITQAVDLDTMESNIATNNAKNSYPTTDATKVGFISITQAVDLDAIESDVATNNAKVGITTQQASDITTNNNKVSMVLGTTAGTALEGNTALLQLGTTSTTALAGDTTIPDNNNQLENGANYITASSTDALTNKSGSNSQWTNDEGYTTNVGTVTEVTVGTGLDVTNGTTTPNVTLDLTEITVGTGLDTTATGISLDLSEFTDMSADMVETDEFIVLDNGAERRKAVNEIKSTLFSNNDLYKVIGVATDHSSRVLSDSGTSEGATSIMQNFEILIAN